MTCADFSGDGVALVFVFMPEGYAHTGNNVQREATSHPILNQLRTESLHGVAEWKLFLND